MATAKKSAKNKKSSAIKVDFSDVESQALIDEDDYVLEVTEVEQETSENSGEPYLKWTFEIADGDFKGRKVYHNTSLQPQALFNLRGLLEAIGMDIPEGVMEFDPADCIGEKVGASLEHETYKGKKRARPVSFFDSDDVGAEPAKEDKKPAKGDKKKEEKEEVKEDKKTKSKKKKDEPEFEVDDEVTFEDDEGNEQTGKITEIDGDDYTVVVGKGKKATEWTLEADDMTKVE